MISRFLKIDWIQWLLLGFGAWLLVHPNPYQFLVGGLVILPILSFIIHGIKGRPAIDTLFVNLLDYYKSSPLGHMMLATILLGFRVYPDYEAESFWSVFPPSFIAFGLLALFVLATHKPIDSKHDVGILYYGMLSIILLFSSFTTTFAVNCVFDKSDPKVFEVVVLKKSRSSNEDHICYIQVTPWNERRDSIQIEIPNSQYYDIEIGQTVGINLRKGLLGIPWFYINLPSQN